jgi:hypothetical protein
MTGLKMIRVRVARTTIGASLVALIVSGCASAPASSIQDTTSTSTHGPSQAATPALSAFHQQLPLTGHFVSQWTETVGAVEIAQRADGSVWMTLTDFRTGPSPDLRIYLNDGALIKNSDGHWTVDGSSRYVVSGAVTNSEGIQEFEVRGSDLLPRIHSVTVMDYSAPDFLHFGSAGLG